MLELAVHPIWFRRCGLAILIAQLFAFLFGLPPFQAGIWYQTEPILFSLFILCTAGCLWLALGLTKAWLLPAPLHPVFAATAAWVAWQVLVTLGIDTSWDSWFGPPEIGLGAASHVMLLVAAAMTCCLWRDARARHWLMAGGAASLLLSCVLYWLNEDTAGWRPGQWPDYMAFAAAYLWIALFAARRRTSDAMLCAAIAGTFAVLIGAENMSANVLMGGAMLVGVLHNGLRLPRAVRAALFPGRGWKVAAMIGCLLPLCLVALAPYARDFADAPESLESSLADREDSMGSRMAINEVSLAVIANEPERLLLGKGWNSYGDDFFRYVLLDGVSRFQDRVLLGSKALIDIKVFHSHDQPIDALLSFGLIGMLLWYAPAMAAIWTLPRRRFWLIAPMIVAVCGMGNIWFELPQNIVFQAMAIAALCTLGAKHTIKTPLAAPRFAALAGACAAAMLWSAAQQYGAIRYGETLRHVIEDEAYDNVSTQWLAQDARRRCHRFHQVAMYATSQIYENAKRRPLTADDARWYAKWLHAANMLTQSGQCGPQSSEVELRLLSNLFLGFDGPAMNAIKAEANLFIVPAVVRMAQVAPLREDVAAIFLDNLSGFSKGDETLEIDILKHLLAINPRHRPALWLLGKKLAAVPDTRAAGLAMQREALALGLRRVFPLDREEWEAFESAQKEGTR